MKVNAELQDMYRVTLPGGVYCSCMLAVLGYSTELSLLHLYSLIYTFIYERHTPGMRGPIFSANILPSEAVTIRGVRVALGCKGTLAWQDGGVMLVCMR